MKPWLVRTPFQTKASSPFPGVRVCCSEETGAPMVLLATSPSAKSSMRSVVGAASAPGRSTAPGTAASCEIGGPSGGKGDGARLPICRAPGRLHPEVSLDFQHPASMCCLVVDPARPRDRRPLRCPSVRGSHQLGRPSRSTQPRETTPLSAVSRTAAGVRHAPGVTISRISSLAKRDQTLAEATQVHVSSGRLFPAARLS